MKNNFVEILDMDTGNTCNHSQWFDDDFVEDYIRPLTDDELPLMLQSKWKPENIGAKRFEVRRRSKVSIYGCL